MTLRTRIERLERTIPRTRGKFVMIRPDLFGRDPAIAWNGPRHLALSVPDVEAGTDPMDRLTPEQRAMIGPDDTLIILEYVHVPIPTGGHPWAA